MRLLILAAALALPAAAAHARTPNEPPVARAPACDDPSIVHQAKPDRSAKLSKLADLPPANHYLSVYRVIDGCQVPVIAGYGIGSADRRRR